MSEELIHAGLEERERLFVAFQAQDRKTWTDFRHHVNVQRERIKELEDYKAWSDEQLRCCSNDLAVAQKSITRLREVLKSVLSIFPKSEWADRTLYRLVCGYADTNNTGAEHETKTDRG